MISFVTKMFPISVMIISRVGVACQIQRRAFWQLASTSNLGKCMCACLSLDRLAYGPIIRWY